MAWISLEGKHSDHEILSSVDRSGVVVDLVLSQVDRGGPIAVPTISARVVGAVPAGFAVVDPPTRGRCVRFPGQDGLVGVRPAGEIVAESAIDEVVGIGVPVNPESPVDTRGFLRPSYEDGRLVLLVEPTVDGLRPVEIEDPHQCCGGEH